MIKTITILVISLIMIPIYLIDDIITGIAAILDGHD